MLDWIDSPQSLAALLLTLLSFAPIMYVVRWRRAKRSDLVVPGVVLVLASAPYRDTLATLSALVGKPPKDSPLLEADLRSTDDDRSDRPRLVEVLCIPGREREAVRLLRTELGRASVDRGRVLVSREPLVQWESLDSEDSTVAPATLLPALDQVLRAAVPGPIPDAATATVVVIDKEIDDSACRALPRGDAIHRLEDRRLVSGHAVADQSRQGHGTAVIAAVRAAAPETPILWVSFPARLPGKAAWLARVLRAVEDLAPGQRLVVNLSWSWLVDYLDAEDDFVGMADTIFDLAAENGVVVVAAAGNHKTGRPLSPVHYPARHPWVVAVGAAAEDGRRAKRSCFGGKPRGALWFMVAGPVDGSGRPSPLVAVGGKAHGGTSFATAVATGVIARSGLLPPADLPSGDRDDLQAWLTARLGTLAELGDPSGVPGYDPREHGLGLLRMRRGGA
jgi:hypothetical protein